MPDVHKTIVMGQYAVVPRALDNQNKLILEVPAAQVCIIAILRSKSGVGVAHIDTPFHARETIENMIRKLKLLATDASDPISAILVGGNVGDPVFGSKALYQPISQTLHKHNVTYKHSHYSYDLPIYFFISAYLLLRIFDFVGPKSSLGTIVCLAFLFGCCKATNHILKKTFDVSVDTATGKITIFTNDLKNSYRQLQHITHEQHQFFSHRNLLLPRNAKIIDQLKMVDVSPISIARNELHTPERARR